MDRIRYPHQADTRKQSRSTNIENTVIQPMQTVHPNNRHCQVNTLIEAAASFDDHQTKALNINRIFNILQCMEVINTREIMIMTNLEKRQAQKYLRAVKFILPYIESHFHSTDNQIALTTTHQT